LASALLLQLAAMEQHSNPSAEDGPDVANREAKAARLSRYAELRWSLATKPLLIISDQLS